MINRAETRILNDDVQSALKIKIKAYALNVNGKNLAVFRTKEEAENLLEDIIKPYKQNKDSKIEDINFKEDVNIVETYAQIDDFYNYEETLYYITKGTNETRVHKVEKGENFWVIADKYNVPVSNLLKANPEVDPERIQIGQEISLVVPKPFITVVTTETKEYEEYIPYETEYEETSALFRGEYRVKRYGERGQRQIKAKIIKENGIEVDREILSETIVKEPVTKIVLKGTKKPPPRIGTGTFSKPTSRGTITSSFGWRWGRRHEGVDIGMPVGTPVKAADGGKVTFAGWKSGYGKIVIIDHGGNMETRYAHNSELLVKKGDRVYKGQTIAKSGNTGRSTGPHLHFEVRKNGTPVNPLKYIKY
jgi:murein DD-endopeptidase MepM/ murein hydrolase activator NlpD